MIQVQLAKFRQLLERTSLTALVDAMRLVTGRLEFLAGLELLLFDPVHVPSVLERAHLHKMIENEPWLFGEEFSMHVSDRSLTALLKAHVELLGRKELVTAPLPTRMGTRGGSTSFSGVHLNRTGTGENISLWR